MEVWHVIIIVLVVGLFGAWFVWTEGERAAKAVAIAEQHKAEVEKLMEEMKNNSIAETEQLRRRLNGDK